MEHKKSDPPEVSTMTFGTFAWRMVNKADWPKLCMAAELTATFAVYSSKVLTNQNDCFAYVQDRLLKPLGGYVGYSGEWRELAQVISRVSSL